MVAVHSSAPAAIVPSCGFRSCSKRRASSSLPSTPSTLNPQPSTLNPLHSTLNPQPSTLNPQPSTLNPQPSTLNPHPSKGTTYTVSKKVYLEKCSSPDSTLALTFLSVPSLSVGEELHHRFPVHPTPWTPVTCSSETAPPPEPQWDPRPSYRVLGGRTRRQQLTPWT